MIEGVTSISFDYNQLDGDLAAEIQEAAERVRGFTRTAVIEVGHELLRVKERLNHGQFTAWVENECQLLMRTAQRAMRAAEMVGKYDKLSYLPPDGVLALAERSAPQAAVAAVIEEIEAGGRPSAADIRRRLREAKRTSNAATETRKSAALKPILRAWTKLQPADKETALIALWGTLSPAQQAAFRQIIVTAPAGRVPEDETAFSPDSDAVVEMDIAVNEPDHAEESAAAEFTITDNAEEAPAIEAPVSDGPPTVQINNQEIIHSTEAPDSPADLLRDVPNVLEVSDLRLPFDEGEPIQNRVEATTPNPICATPVSSQGGKVDRCKTVGWPPAGLICHKKGGVCGYSGCRFAGRCLQVPSPGVVCASEEVKPISSALPVVQLQGSAHLGAL